MKTKVLTFSGVLKYLNVSNRTFYLKYRPLIKPYDKKGKAHLYRLSDIKEVKEKVKKKEQENDNFEIIDQ